jgi:hypothetical protein
MHALWVKWIKRLRRTTTLQEIGLFILIAVSPVWIYGNPDDPKGTIVASVVGILLAAAGIAALEHPHLIGRRERSLFAILFLIFCWFGFETIRNGVTITELTGFAFEPGTLLSFFLIGAALVSGYFFAYSHHDTRRLLVAITVASSMVAIAFFAAVITGSAPLSAFFGEFFSLQLLFGFSFLCALSLMVMAPPASFARRLSIFAAFLFASALLFSHAELLIASVLCGALMLFFFLHASNASTALASVAPAWVCFFVLLCAAIFNIQSFIPQNVTQSFFTEIRPSLQATTHVILVDYWEDARSPYVGAGMNSFGYIWNEKRPREVNTTPLWNTDFETGSGFVPILGLMFGIPFTIFLILLIGAASVDRFVFFRTSSEIRTVGISWLVLFLFGLLWMFLYVPTIAFFALTFFSFGIALGIRDVAVRLPENHPRFFSAIVRKTSAVIGVSLIVTGLVLICFGVIRFLALWEYENGSQALGQRGAYANAQSDMRASLAIEKLPFVERALAAADEADIQAMLSTASSSPLTLDAIVRLATLRNEAITAAEESRVLDRADYRNWIEEGNARLLHALYDQDTSEALTAAQDFKFAVVLTGTTPLPLFLEAEALYAAGDLKNARSAVEAALTVKPDYEDARLLLDRLMNSTTSP